MSPNQTGSTTSSPACARAMLSRMPTDTFYGLAVDPVNLHAVEQIYQLKTRQKHKPLSLLISVSGAGLRAGARHRPACSTSWPTSSGRAR